MNIVNYNATDQLYLNSSPTLTYGSYQETRQYNPTNGQYKLLLSEVQFLANFWSYDTGKKTLIVYAGSSPGHHFNMLFRMFPDFFWHLYDPRPFEAHYDKKKVTVFQSYFTSQIAASYNSAKYSDYQIYFISDIRTVGLEIMYKLYLQDLQKYNDTGIYLQFDDRYKVINEREILALKNDLYTDLSRQASDIIDEDIYQEMLMQKEWCVMMQPKQAQLKFRLPYNTDVRNKVKFYNGKCFWGVYNKPNSTETRLVPKFDLAFTDYNIDYYNDALYYHNIHRAEKKYYYKNNYYNFDQVVELSIIDKYIQSFKDKNWYPSDFSTSNKFLMSLMRKSLGFYP